MSQRTKPITGKREQNKRPRNDDETAQADDEIEEIPKDTGVIGQIHMAIEKFASTGLGQIVLEQCDRVMKIVEDTARWSMPLDESSDIKLERPLPWVFFLMLIVWLRFLRFFLNVSSTVVGTPHFSRQSMVYSIQIKRRNLRAIRVRGMKVIGNRESDSVATSSSGQTPSILGKVSNLFSSAVCRPGQQRDVPARRTFVESDLREDNSAASRFTTKRPRDDENVELNLTVDQMLNKYANENSEDDSDYVPTLEEDSDESSSTEESNISVDGSEKEPEEKSSDTIINDSATTSADEVKENGAPQNRPPIPTPDPDTKADSIADADTDNEPVKSLQEQDNKSDSERDTVSGKQTTEVDPKKPQELLNTPPVQRHQLKVAQDEEDEKKSTPGHMTAAFLKPAIDATTSQEPKPNISEPKDIPPSASKLYRTITTQTSVEYDWSIVLKTEISHIWQPVGLPKLDSSVQQLTPASSSEDIFYSPIGSSQDIHSMFHPVPLVKVHVAEAESTPKGNDDSSTPESSALAQPHQKKPMQPRPNKQQPQHNFYNKYRNRNRR